MWRRTAPPARTSGEPGLAYNFTCHSRLLDCASSRVEGGAEDSRAHLGASRRTSAHLGAPRRTSGASTSTRRTRRRAAASRCVLPVRLHAANTPAALAPALAPTLAPTLGGPALLPVRLVARTRVDAAARRRAVGAAPPHPQPAGRLFTPPAVNRCGSSSSTTSLPSTGPTSGRSRRGRRSSGRPRGMHGS